MTTFNSGDIVQLKSGSPAMTVDFVSGDDVTCNWFVNDEVKTAVFKDKALKIHVSPRGLTKEEANHIMKSIS